MESVAFLFSSSLLTVAFLGDQIDTGIDLACTTWPFAPQPHLVEQPSIPGVEQQVLRHQLLELRAALVVTGRPSERLEYLVH